MNKIRFFFLMVLNKVAGNFSRAKSWFSGFSPRARVAAIFSLITPFVVSGFTKIKMGFTRAKTWWAGLSPKKRVAIVFAIPLTIIVGSGIFTAHRFFSDNESGAISAPTSLVAATKKSTETLRIIINETPENVAVDPPQVYADAGETVEFHATADTGFFVDGNYQSRTLPPYHEEAHVVIITADGKSYRLDDKISGMKIPVSGNIRFKVVVKTDGQRIWSGSNMVAKRLSEWKKGAVVFTITRPKLIGADTSVAKKVKEGETTRLEVAKKAAGASNNDGLSLEERQSFDEVKTKLKAAYNYLFNQPL